MPMFTIFLKKIFLKGILSTGVNHYVSDSSVIPQIHFTMTYIDKTGGKKLIFSMLTCFLFKEFKSNVCTIGFFTSSYFSL